MLVLVYAFRRQIVVLLWGEARHILQAIGPLDERSALLDDLSRGGVLQQRTGVLLRDGIDAALLEQTRVLIVD